MAAMVAADSKVPEMGERERERERAFERIPADADHARSAFCCTGQRVGRIAAVTGGERFIKSS